MSAMIASGLSTSRFLQLPGEIRNMIYQFVYDGLNEEDTLNILKVSRSWYNEVLPVIVSDLYHIFMIRFNSLWNLTDFQIMKKKAPEGILRHVKHLQLRISIEHESHPDLPSQINELETNLRRVVMTLVHAGARLESLYIDIDEGEDDDREALGSTLVFELLDNLRGLHVTKDVLITGLVNDHSEYLEYIKYSMLLQETSGLSYHEFQITPDKKPTLGMCLDIQKYIRTCRRIVEHWDDDEHIDKKAASLKDLAQICPEVDDLEQQLDSLTVLPNSVDTNIRQTIIPQALERIENFDKSITNPRLRRYSKNAPFDQLTDAYNRIYMRKSFLEINPGGHQQPSVDDHDLHFQEDARYENSPWHALSYEEYNELPPIGDWEPINDDQYWETIPDEYMGNS